VTRQAREQRRLRGSGKCVVCWQPAATGRARCPKCLVADNERFKARKRREVAA
jgi:hypothetical protein